MRLPSPALLLACLLLVLPAARAADNTADEAEVAFSLGNRAFARGQYPEALQAWFLSYRLVPNRNVLFNIARCYEELGRFDEAYRYFHDVLQLGLEGEDAREVREALARLAPRVALLTLTSSPPGAEVTVERKDLGGRGHTPLTLALPPGTHRVLLEKEGHRPAELSVSLVRGRTLTREVALEEVRGTLLLTGGPAGAQVREGAGGAVLGEVPARLSLRPGPHLLQVEAPSHLAATLQVEVVADAVREVQVALVPAPRPQGRLVVTATREAAAIQVDGRPAGFTPAVLTLPEGPHRVEVAARDVSPLVREVEVRAGEEVRLHAELRYLPPPVRAASKGLTRADDAPASTTVLTQEELRAFGFTTLAEALALVRGFFLTDDRQYTYLGVRGFSTPGDLNTRVLILWDGHPTGDIWGGQGFSARELTADLDEVERIEVVRGPGSALYGTNAFFAVINVVPRQRLPADTHGEATLGAGALGAWRAHLAAGLGEEGGGSLLVSGGAFLARGAETTPLPGVGRVEGLDAERSLTASARAHLGDFSLVAHLTQRLKDIPTAPFDTAPGEAGTRVRDAYGFLEGRYEKALSASASVFARLAFDLVRYHGEWRYREGAADAFRLTDSGEADWVSGEARGTFSLFSGNTLTAGLEVQGSLRVAQAVFGPPEAPPLPSLQRLLVSGYLLDEWQLHPRLRLSAGVRVDRYGDLDVLPVSPRLALVGRPYAGGLTRLVAGTAFRAPTLYELHYADGVSQRAPDRLAPETIATLELEHSHDLTEELRLTLGAWRNDIAHLVALVTEAGDMRCGTAEAPAACLVYTNASERLGAVGLEAGLRWQPGRFTLVDASYTFAAPQGDSAGLTLGAPQHLVNGRLLVPLADSAVRLALSGLYQSGRRTPEGERYGEALLVGVGLSGEFQRLRYFAGVQNLLDVDYALPVGEEFRFPAVPQYGRRFSLQVTTRF